ncbi:MAG: hypothetical protein DWQ01_07365 [Planctomycetota bacterium]|nr:MAG: hypothetical protein DWQ01_07365 [Planctomycetota bacterium]
MIRSIFPLFFASLLLLSLCSCFASGESNPDTTNSTERLAAQAGSGGGANSDLGELKPLPDIQYPEDQMVQLEREYEVLIGEGVYRRFQELVYADGQGNVAMELIGLAEDREQPFQNPSALEQMYYDLRQRYLLRYRDVHLRDESRFRQNYGMEELPGTVTLAGRSCRQHVAHSRHGFGDVHFFIDESTDLLLGWSIFDPEGVETARLRTTAVDFQPNFSGVTWSQPLIPEQPYRGAVDDAALGFTPKHAIYRPNGFFPESTMMLLGQVFTNDLPNIHFEVNHDGLRVLFIAQHPSEQQQSKIGPNQIIVEAQSSRIGGISVLEATRDQIHLYIVGAVSQDEEATILGSIY